MALPHAIKFVLNDVTTPQVEPTVPTIAADRRRLYVNLL